MMFTRQELDLLFEAIEKWEQEDFGDEMAGTMVEAMAKASGASGDHIKRVQEERLRRSESKKIATRLRKERGVLLRAKLIQIRDQMDAEKFMEGGASS